MFQRRPLPIETRHKTGAGVGKPAQWLMNSWSLRMDDTRVDISIEVSIYFVKFSNRSSTKLSKDTPIVLAASVGED